MNEHEDELMYEDDPVKLLVRNKNTGVIYYHCGGVEGNITQFPRYKRAKLNM